MASLAKNRDDGPGTPITPTPLSARDKMKFKITLGGGNGGDACAPPRPPPQRGERSASDPSLPVAVSLNGKGISSPILNVEATANLSPVKNRKAGKPIMVEPMPPVMSGAEMYKRAAPRRVSLSTG